MADSVAVQKLLMDGKAEARQKGTQEVSMMVSKLFRDIPPPESYTRTLQQIDVVNRQLLQNVSANARRGGLATLRAIVGVVPMSDEHGAGVTKTLCDVAFPLVRDQDPSIRVNALELCHQVVHKFRGQVFQVAFTDLFRAMLAAVADKDRKVVTAAKELSSTVRQIVTDTRVSDFPIDKFVDFLNFAFETTDAFVVNWVLDWHKHVNMLPTVGLVRFLSRYLRSIFKLLELADSAHSAEETLVQALEDVKVNADSLQLVDLMKIALDFTCVVHRLTRRVALEWVHTLLHVGHDRMLPLTHQIANAVVDQQNSKNEPTVKSIATRINRDLQELITARVLSTPGTSVPSTPKKNPSGNSLQQIPSPGSGAPSLAGSPPTAQDADDPLVLKTATPPPGLANGAAAGSSVSSPPEDPMANVRAIEASALVSRMVAHLRSEEASHLAALQWIVLLHKTFPAAVQERFDYIFDSILDTFANPSPQVLKQSIATLSTIAGETRFGHFIQLLLVKMEKNASVLLPKASVILKHLQLWYQGDKNEKCESVFLQVAQTLPSREDKRFVCKVVITMNTMLLTSPEMRSLRDLLKAGIGNRRANAAFRGLYDCWCHDSIATLSLCLLTRAYDLAHSLVVSIGNAEMAPHTLVQLDRLVQLLETPVFAFARIALLTPRRNRALVRTLFGLQMILPQTSDQYNRLHKRLRTVSSVVPLEEPDEVSVGGDSDAAVRMPRAECEALEKVHVRVQEELLAYEEAIMSAGHFVAM